MDPVVTALGVVVESLAVELTARVMRDRAGGRRQLAQRKVQRLVKGAAERVHDALGREMAGLSEEEWQDAVRCVLDSLEAVAPIDLDDLLTLELRPDTLADYVRTHAANVACLDGLSEQGQAAYRRILALACEEILLALVALPEFGVLLGTKTFQTLVELRREVDRLRPPAERSDDGAVDFESRYLDHVVGTLGRLELFGVSRGRVPRVQSFDDAYVRLAVARAGVGGANIDDDELTGAGLDAANGVLEHPRVLVRGGAGAGKTTLLRWLAVLAARGQVQPDGATRPTVPFFVPLRHFAHRELPAPEDLPETIAKVIATEMPAGWVNGLVREGRAVLLVDGVDELAPSRRAEVREWIEQFVTAYDRLRVVISVRPFALPEDWLVASEFVTFDLLPMSPTGMRLFLEAWHGAARSEYAADPDMLAWLEECERSLAEQLAARSDLRQLAGSPLLCGLLCALHQDRNMHLPRDRKGLYDAALDLLLVRWDEARRVQVEDWPTLSREEQVVLLQRFAYSMVKNHDLVVERGEAARRFLHAMRGLRSQDAVDAEPVLQRMLERTGLLREPGPDEVQFVHRTFRDFLAAKEVVDAGDLAFVAEQAHLDHWHDVFVNTVALARPREREWLVRKLLEGNSAAQADPRTASRLHLVAAACLEHADVLDSDELRPLVHAAAERLIPPASLDEADLLALAGPFVLDLLPGPDGLTSDQAACVVRTAAMIGGPQVREKLAQFVPLGETRVVDELLRAWRRSQDPVGYARAVLAEVDFGDRSLEVRGWHRIKCLKHLRRLTNVVCFGDFAGLEEVAAVPNLRRLELVQNEMIRDIAPLVACTTLRSLALTSGCQFLRDLSPLARTTVEDLSLHLVAADLDSIRSDRLVRLAIRDPRIGDGLDALPADLPLRELVVDNLPRNRNLAGIERWTTLQHVSVRGSPGPEEVAALAKLPHLQRLTLVDAAGADLTDLRLALPGVTIGAVDSGR